MIIVNLKGGTGNQLFQYALGRHLAIKNNDTLKLDVGGLARANEVGDIYRPFTIKDFNILQEIATPAEIKKLKYPFGLLSKAWRFISFHLSRDKNVLFNPHMLEKRGNLYLDGFWQSPKFFTDIKDVLLKEFTLKSPLSVDADYFAKQIQAAESVSLHVRRGDYAKNAKVAFEFGPCSPEYYKRAIEYIRDNTTAVPTYFVFSDEIAWVKQNLPLGSNVAFVQSPNITGTEELMLMSLCKHNITANSSFSWWGAWLNQHSAKIVIAPTPWFDHQPFDTDLIPPSWIQIPK